MSLSPVQQQLMEALAAKILGEDKGMQVMPFYITGFLDSLLFGVALSQLFSYWHFVKTDKKYIVAIVCISMLCALGTTLCILLWMQDLFVWGFGTYLTFTKVAWIGRYEAINVAATLTVQGFYIDRACRLYKHWWPALVISPFALGAAASGIAFVHLGYLQHEYVTPELLESRLIKSLAYSLLGFTFAADCFITTCIVVGLYRLRTGWTHTDSTLRRLIIQCFEAQVPALTIQLIAFVLWNQVYQVGLPFVMNQTKVYVLGLLITLNLRSRVNTATNVSHPSAGLDKTSQSGSYHMSSLERSSKDDGGDKNVHATLAPVDTPHPGSSDWLHTYASTEHLRSGHTNPV